MQKKNELTSIIIVSHNAKELLGKCLESILKNISKSVLFEIIVVDSGSNEDIESFVREYKSVRFAKYENIGFSKANNLGASMSAGDYLLFLNPDTYIHPGAVEKLIESIEKSSKIGAVSPMLLNVDGTTQASCFRLPSIKGAILEFWLNRKSSFLKYAPVGNKPSKIDCAVGACVLIKKNVFNMIGKWDEKYFMYFEDIELGRKIKSAGLEFLYIPQSKITHFHGGSSTALPIV